MLPSVSAFEASRIFVDRLVSQEHKKECQLIIREVFRSKEEDLYAPMPGTSQWNTTVMGKNMGAVQKQQYMAQLTKSINRYGKLF